MRLAILDDDRELCAQVASIMRSEGHSCFEFHSGEALRRALRRESYDLLLLDWELPDLSGIDLLPRPWDMLHRPHPCAVSVPSSLGYAANVPSSHPSSSSSFLGPGSISSFSAEPRRSVNPDEAVCLVI